MTAKRWMTFGGLLAAAAVACGAFGAHGLETSLHNELDSRVRNNRLEGDERDRAIADTERRLKAFDTAVRYHMYHALAVVVTGILGLKRLSPAVQAAGWLFVAGIVLFSGLLYAWVLFDVRILAMIVPIGGVSFIGGWLAFAWAARQLPTSDSTSGVGS